MYHAAGWPCKDLLTSEYSAYVHLKRVLRPSAAAPISAAEGVDYPPCSQFGRA